MAKLFSNISRTSTRLSERYSDSTVNNEFTTFKELRQTVSGGAPSQLLVTNRPKKVYDLYTDPNQTSIPITREYQESRLISMATVTRIRREGFYNSFRNANPRLTIINRPTNETLVEIKPYTQVRDDEAYAVDTSRMLQDSQSLPLISGPRDLSRMNKYFRTNEGTSFKVFQQVLQSGTTFAQARSYNPASVETMILNYSNTNFNTPLTRVPRLIEGNAILDANLQGRLQRETVIDRQGKLALKFVGGSPPPTGTGLFGVASTALGGFTQSIINRTRIGQLGRALDNIRAVGQAVGAAIDINNATLEKDQTAYDALYRENLWPLTKENDGTIKNFQTAREAYIARARAAINSEKAAAINKVNKTTDPYPEAENDYRSSLDYTDILQSVNARNPRGSGLLSARYLKDTFNLLNDRPIKTLSQLQNSSEDSNNVDYVTFKVTVPGVPELESGIKFRAFIGDFNHSSKGQYEEIRYVGRPERFVTYKGMNRSTTFSLYLIAFSEDELSGMWTRANLLNKLVFPIKDAGGFMVPPLTKLTIGDVFDNQPGYVENVDMRFQEIPWDITYELPMAIQINMTFNIIENAFITQQADSSNLFAINQLRAATLPPATPNPQLILGSLPGLPTINEAGLSRATSVVLPRLTTPPLPTPPTSAAPEPTTQPRRQVSTLINRDAARAQADATRVALPQPRPAPAYFYTAQQAFGPSAASTNLQSAFSNLSRPSQAGPTIGPRP